MCSSHLDKEVNHRQGNDENGEEGSGQTDDKKGPQNPQQTQDPSAEGLGDGLIYCKYILLDKHRGNVDIL